MDNEPGDSLGIMPGAFECYLYFCAGNIRSGTISGAFYTVGNGYNYTYLTTELPHSIFSFSNKTISLPRDYAISGNNRKYDFYFNIVGGSYINKAKIHLYVWS